MGASEVLKRLAVAKKSSGAEGKFAQELAAYKKEAAALGPEESGSRWAALALSFRDERNAQGSDVGVDVVMAVLPPPGSWPTISQRFEEAAKAKKDGYTIAWRMLGHALLNQPAAVNADIAAVQSLGGQRDNPYFGTYLATLVQAVAVQNGDAAMIVKSVEAQLKPKVLKPAEEGERDESIFNDDVRRGAEPQSVAIPDLVGLVGAAKAEEIYGRFLKMTTVDLTFSGRESNRIARKLVQELLPVLKAPQFSVASTPEGASLYPALAKKFPKGFASTRLEARRAYVWSEVLAGKGSEVKGQSAVLVVEEGARTARPISSKADAKLVADYLDSELRAKPQTSTWTLYAQSSIISKQSDRAIALMKSSLTRSDLKPAQVEAIRSPLCDVLLASDKVDEAIPLIQKQLHFKGDQGTMGYLAAQKLARLGDVLNRTDLIDEALRFRYTINPEMSYYSWLDPSLIDLRIKLRRFGDAEQVILDTLSESLKHSESGMDAQYGSNMEELAQVYYAAGRYSDVVALLDQSPYWQVADLADIESNPYSNRTSDDFGFYVADSLAKTGRRAEALKVINWALDRHPGFDPSYGLLIELEGANALPRLDELAARNRFQERPLIWKAKVLLGQGKLDEADKTIRKAISIDPSDGETTGGHRMYGYTVFADILDAEGKKQEADTFRSAVKAIRMSEHADELLAAGLVNEAVKLYAQSLDVFTDAYCIQSRLAVQLASEGRYTEAEEHYRRAFELMPSSFGEMESHCFGCEGVFAGPAENIAESVFQDLLKKTPDKPQVHYLMGYLREEEGRAAEALGYFRKASQLDPDYINAWKHMRDLADTTAVKPDEMKRIESNLIRLDPLGDDEYSRRTFRSPDLAAIYRATANVLPPPVDEGGIYPLPVSAAALEKLKGQSGYGSMMVSGPSTNVRTPGDAVAQGTVVSVILQLVQMSPMMTAVK